MHYQMVASQAEPAIQMRNFARMENIFRSLHSNTKLEAEVEKLKPWAAVVLRKLPLADSHKPLVGHSSLPHNHSQGRNIRHANLDPSRRPNRDRKLLGAIRRHNHCRSHPQRKRPSQHYPLALLPAQG
jgi:hypothetical protein